MASELIGQDHAEQSPAPAHIPEKITRQDIRPVRLAPGETQIVLQRHGEYVRDQHHDRAGSLTEAAQASEAIAARAYFEDLLSRIDPEERGTVDVLVVASDTRYYSKGQRSYETASIAQDTARQVFAEHGLSPSQILPAPGEDRGPDKPWTMSTLREPHFLTHSPAFAEFLRQKYGDEKAAAFWKAFEEDLHQTERLQHGAEGPEDIAARTALSVRQLSAYAHAYHQANPGRRLIIWATTHYDTISPLIRRDVLGLSDWKNHYLGVDYGGGIAITIDSTGTRAATNIGGNRLAIPRSLILRQGN